MVITACILRSVFLTLFLSASAGDFDYFYYFSQPPQGTYLIRLNSPYVTPVDNSV